MSNYGDMIVERLMQNTNDHVRILNMTKRLLLQSVTERCLPYATPPQADLAIKFDSTCPYDVNPTLDSTRDYQKLPDWCSNSDFCQHFTSRPSSSRDTGNQLVQAGNKKLINICWQRLNPEQINRIHSQLSMLHYYCYV